MDRLSENIQGTPQGGIISPLLANIALHGMENHLKNWICTKPSFGKTNKYSNDAKRKSLAIIRYADDFVIIHKEKSIPGAALFACGSYCPGRNVDSLLRYTENDDPQPQVVWAFGLRMMNCAPCRSSL